MWTNAPSEFPTYPTDALPEIPTGFVDISWGMDSCPCLGRGDLRIWVEWPYVWDRIGPHYILTNLDEESETELTLLETDDWNEILAHTEEYAS